MYDEIQAELERQKTLGSEDYDKVHTQSDWQAIICSYATRCNSRLFNPKGTFRESMVKVAALAVAAIEAHDQGYC